MYGAVKSCFEIFNSFFLHRRIFTYLQNSEIVLFYDHGHIQTYTFQDTLWKLHSKNTWQMIKKILGYGTSTQQLTIALINWHYAR
jgi:hypothetical protein